MQGFRHKTPIQVRFSDTDMMGHVNNAAYFSYAETARLMYYDTVLGTDIDWHTQHGQIMARFEIDYREALTYGDEVAVYTRCSRLGTKSFDLSWLITRKDAAGEMVAAEGKTVIVCYDYASRQAKEIPSDRRSRITAFEGL